MNLEFPSVDRLKTVKIERSLLVFLISGGIAFLVDAGVTMAANAFTGSLIGARGVGFLFAVLTTWLINRTFGFQTGRKPFHELIREFVAYLMLMGFGALINLGVYSLFIKSVGPTIFHSAAPFGVPAQQLLIVCGIALGTLSGMTLNYLSSRRVLKRKDQQSKLDENT